MIVSNQFCLSGRENRDVRNLDSVVVARVKRGIIAFFMLCVTHPPLFGQTDSSIEEDWSSTEDNCGVAAFELVLRAYGKDGAKNV